MKAKGLIPLRNFGEVEPHKVYRSAQPQYLYEYVWLQKEVGVKTLVNLRSELHHDDQYAEELGFKMVSYNIPEHLCPTVEQARDFMNLVRASPDIPILVHCAHGRGRTSTFCVLARLAVGWKLEDALKEEEEVFGYEFNHKDQLKFLKDNFS